MENNDKEKLKLRPQNNRQATNDEIEMCFKEFQPKLQNRFIAYLDGIPEYLIKKIGRPSGEYNSKTKKFRWNPLSLELYDPVAPSAAQSVKKWIDNNLARDLTIKILDPTGDPIEEWFIKGAKISVFDFGTLDWKSDDLLIIKITLIYESAKLSY